MWYTEETSMELRIDKKCVLSKCRLKKIYNISLSMCVHVLFVILTEINISVLYRLALQNAREDY